MPLLPSHCVILPSYNSGRWLAPTLASVLEAGVPVYLVIDGSTDQSEGCLEGFLGHKTPLNVLRLAENRGKGAAVLEALEAASLTGFSHALVFDSDGQHEPRDIPAMLSLSLAHPEAMVLGAPRFGPDAPLLRVLGRRIANWWTNLETLWGGIQDSLFGLRVYPVAESLKVLHSISGGRRFDFETQLCVRLYWSGVPSLNYSSKVLYPPKADGGISHFNYWRDNLLLIRTHSHLLMKAIFSLPMLWKLRRKNRSYRAYSAALAQEVSHHTKYE